MYMFSVSASLLALSLFMCGRKRGCGGDVYLNTSYIMYIDMRYVLIISEFVVFVYWHSVFFGNSCVKFVAILCHYISRGVFKCLHGIFFLLIIVTRYHVYMHNIKNL